MKKLLVLCTVLLSVSLTAYGDSGSKDLSTNAPKVVSVKLSGEATEKIDFKKVSMDIKESKYKSDSLALKDLEKVGKKVEVYIEKIKTDVEGQNLEELAKLEYILSKQDYWLDSTIVELEGIIKDFDNAIAKNENIVFEKEMENKEIKKITVTPAHLLYLKAYIRQAISGAYYLGAYDFTLTQEEMEKMGQTIMMTAMMSGKAIKVGETLDQVLPQNFLSIRNVKKFAKSKEVMMLSLKDMEESLKYLKKLGPEGEEHLKVLYELRDDMMDGKNQFIKVKDANLSELMVQLQNVKKGLNGPTMIEFPLEGKTLSYQINISKMFGMDHRKELISFLNCITIDIQNNKLSIDKDALAVHNFGGYLPNGVKNIVDQIEENAWMMIPEELPLSEMGGMLQGFSKK